MNQNLQSGSPFIYMKVGTHAQETLSDIISRKKKEIEEAGFALWGYGGNTCHPRTAVQPFARGFERSGGTIYLCMQEIDSHHFHEPVRAQHYSVDGTNWNPIPRAVNALGSKFALVLKDLTEADIDLSLANTEVGVGAKQGTPGVDYIRGRVDKACLVVAGSRVIQGPKDIVKIGLIASLASPYAVFLKTS